jgi:hypothetical protein
MKNPAIDGICIDIVFAFHIKVAVCIGTDLGVRVAQCAADVNMC